MEHTEEDRPATIYFLLHILRESAYSSSRHKMRSSWIGYLSTRIINAFYQQVTPINSELRLRPKWALVFFLVTATLSALMFVLLIIYYLTVCSYSIMSLDSTAVETFDAWYALNEYAYACLAYKDLKCCDIGWGEGSYSNCGDWADSEDICVPSNESCFNATNPAGSIVTLQIATCTTPSEAITQSFVFTTSAFGVMTIVFLLTRFWYFYCSRRSLDVALHKSFFPVEEEVEDEKGKVIENDIEVEQTKQVTSSSSPSTL